MVNNELKQKTEHKSRKSVDSVKRDKSDKRKHSSSRDSSRSKSPIHKKRHSGKKQKTRHKKRSRSTSSNSSSTDSDKERERKKRKKAKKKAKKIIKELKKIQKRKEKSESKSRSKSVESNQKDSKPCNDVPLELMDKSRSMAPMTKEEWEKRQSVVKRVYDEETGRHRLIKGDGEVIEEIVSRDRHKAINKQATQGDGDFFQKRLDLDKNKK